MAGAQVDEIDERIIAALEADARCSMRRLAEQVHVSRANVYARVDRLVSSGVITGFAAMTDPVARGWATSAYITLNIRQSQWRAVHEQLRALDGVEHIALVGGEFDVILLVRARDNADLRRLVLDEFQAIDGVLSTRTLLLFDESHPLRR